MEPFIQILGSSFEKTLSGIVDFVPLLLVSLVIISAGWALGLSFEKVIAHISRSLKLDTLSENAGLKALFERADIKIDIGKFLGALVKWFIILTFLIAAFEIIGLTAVNQFLSEVILTYIPRVIIATLIILFSALAAGIMQRIVVSSTKAIGLETAHFLGSITSWSIWITGFIFALAQLGIVREFMQILFTGIVAMLALAGGLSFGLGGRDAAKELIEKLKNDISRKGS